MKHYVVMVYNYPKIVFSDKNKAIAWAQAYGDDAFIEVDEYEDGVKNGKSVWRSDTEGRIVA